ncbi:hypothetical protein [Mesorhizobium sp. M00.F.Ca.ET.216.01.1.1]|uniref:hypothetical protein n=1 Tax=Mesorhizobium sp. M00.F.Ca.ET.216.01.1.1 TaxID=2500528 RepID=UPI000FD99AF6|nr:hypothetical protein [Mesorhizobium sp. M00.F.Ca.ET.216.01.1.1]TGQ37732.1 hypothetical protein EN859_019445 [Mesorhizobium sp. M00.F.Ca.ET.216.01.1.1]TJW48757.1 MAG: hypothetical protein E5W83_01945 [Mesorhizobium sp.]
MAKAIPHDPAFDSTIALLREGYDFIGRRGDRLSTDIFATRLMLKRAICVRGASAAEMFYGGNHFTRNGGMPQMTMRLLQDKGSVQSLDNGAHRHRKAMFLSILLAPEQIEHLRTTFRDEWLAAMDDWQRRDEISLFDEVYLVLTRSVVRGSGLPLDGKSPADLCLELSGMVENAGDFGPSTWLALWRRRLTERFVGFWCGGPAQAPLRSGKALRSASFPSIGTRTEICLRYPTRRSRSSTSCGRWSRPAVTSSSPRWH